jgi:hypothetical protein
MVWTSSGSESGALLVAGGGSTNRPDFVLCTQGVVAGLVTKGEDLVIIGTVYVSDQVIRPVFRNNWEKKPLRSLYIPRSSIEFAYDKLLERLHLRREDVAVPKVEKTGFPMIVSLLTKESESPDALSFGLLVDPFITNILTGNPQEYTLGEGGLYNLYYSIVVRRADLATIRPALLELLRSFKDIDHQLAALVDQNEFIQQVWGRRTNDVPDRLPRMVTFELQPLRLGLSASTLRKNLENEINYLVTRYPDQLRAPASVDALVDDSLLKEIWPERVTP